MAAFILEKLCLSCQRCLRVCPTDAIKMDRQRLVVDADLCDECEECMEACMHGAITFRSEEEAIRLASLELELDDLIKRWPAHSVKPELIIKREELEEEIVSIRKYLARIKD